MYLVLGGKTRPFLEANLDDVSYEGVYNAFNQMRQVKETWRISGRIVNDDIGGTSAAAAWMTEAVKEFRTDLVTANRPRVTFLTDDMSVSAYDMDPMVCVEGPTIQDISFPIGEDIYTTGHNYSFGVTATRAVGSGHDVLEFSESLENSAGGRLIGHVGGIVNPAEPQVFKEFEPWRWSQTGSAVGMYGYPLIPGPIYPANQIRPVRIKLYGPEIIYPVPQRFKIDWSYEFESNVALPPTTPHTFFA